MATSGKARSLDGFTLIEVMIAMTVLVLVFASTVSALTLTFHVVEDSRMDTLASQVLQSEMETVRLKNWSEVNAMPASANFAIDSTLAIAAFNRFTCVRTISVVQTDMKEVALVVSWIGTDGRPRTRRYLTYVAKGGLNDYFYSHP